MAKNYKEINEKRQEAKNNVYELFAETMIKRLEEMQKSNWKKPWVPAKVQYPRNISGREYNARNALLLMYLTEDKNYPYPLFATSSQINKENYSTTGKGFKKDKDGNKLPIVHILKGEKGTPVLFSDMLVYKRDDNKKIPYSTYLRMSDEEKKDYEVKSFQKPWTVFNIDQTNLKEARPELYQKLTMPFDRKSSEKTLEGMFEFEPIDKMISDNLWRCPIITSESNQAYFSPIKDEIHVPLKAQFKDGELFYGTTLHEMIHSTGVKSCKNRDLQNSFGSDAYAREELVAELGAAMVASYYGFAKHIRQDSAEYLKSWLDSLKKEPNFIKDVLSQMREASEYTKERINKIQLSLLKENSVRPSVEQLREIGSILSKKDTLEITDFQNHDNLDSHLSLIEFDEIGSKFARIISLRESLENGKYLEGYDKNDEKQVKTAKMSTNLEISIAKENLLESLNKLASAYGEESVIEYKKFEIMKEGVLNEQDLLNFGKYLSNPIRKENGIAYNAKDDVELLTPKAKEGLRLYLRASEAVNACKDPNLRHDLIDERENAFYNFNETLKNERNLYGEVAVKTYERVNGPTVKEKTALGTFAVPQWAVEYITTRDSSNLTDEQKSTVDKFIKSIVNDKYEAVVNWDMTDNNDKNPAFRRNQDRLDKEDSKTVRIEFFEIKYDQPVKVKEETKIDGREEEDIDISIDEDGDIEAKEEETLAPDKKNDNKTDEEEEQGEGRTKSRSFRR